MLEELEINIQIFYSHTQLIAKLNTQVDQQTTTLNRREEEELTSQSISDPTGQYKVESSNAHETFSEHIQAVTLRSGKVIEQPNTQTENYFEVDVSKNIIKEATPRIISQDPVYTRWDPFGVDDFNVDGYTRNVNTLLEPSNFSTTPLWVEKLNQYLLQ